MNKDEVLELLKTVKYPGFSRDIVSFGLIKEVEIEGEDVSVSIRLSTASEEGKREIQDRVEKALRSSGSFHHVDVRIAAPPQQEISGATAQGGVPVSGILLPGVKYTIAIASGKGGVGKSTVAANIAAALVHRNYKVGLLDLDIYGPSLPILLGINEQPMMTRDRKLLPLEKFGMKVMSFGFLSGNQTPVIWRGPMVAKMTEQFFSDVLWESLDFLILDLPPGTGDVQLTLVQKLRLSGAIMVTTPQDLAVSDVRKGADMFGKVRTPLLGVIENMAGYIVSGFVRDEKGRPLKNSTVSFAEMDGFKETHVDDEGKFQVEIDIFKRGGGVAESVRLDVPLLGEIPISQELMEACDDGTPLVIKDPGSPVSQAFAAIADKLEESVRNT